MEQKELKPFVGESFIDGDGVDWAVSERKMDGVSRIVKVNGTKRRVITDGDLGLLNEQRSPFDQVPIERDGTVLEVVGRAVKLFYRKGNKRNRIVIEALDGRKAEATIPKISGFAQLLWRSKIPGKDYGLPGDYVRDGDYNNRLTDSQRDEVLKRILAKPRVYLFRIVDGDKNVPNYRKDWLLATLTERWTKVNDKDLKPMVRQAFGEEMEITSTPSNGAYGGNVVAHFTEEDLIKPMVFVDAGMLNGNNAVHVFAIATMKVDQTQLTFEVRKKLRPMTSKAFWGRKIHVGEMESDFDRDNAKAGTFQDALYEAEAAIREISDLILRAQHFTLCHDDQVSIACFYIKEKAISKKTWEKLGAVLSGKIVDDDTILPDATLWRLSQAFTWLADNGEEIKPGVADELRRVAGELVAVSPKHREFLSLCEKALKPKVKKDDGSSDDN